MQIKLDSLKKREVDLRFLGNNISEDHLNMVSVYVWENIPSIWDDGTDYELCFVILTKKQLRHLQTKTEIIKTKDKQHSLGYNSDCGFVRFNVKENADILK